jgi:hypothetical protein
MVLEFLRDAMNNKRVILGFIAILFVMMMFMTPWNRAKQGPERPLEKSEPLAVSGPGTYLNTYLHEPVLVDESRNQKIPQVGNGSSGDCGVTDPKVVCQKLPLWSAS